MGWIDRRCPLAQFKVQLRRGDIAGLSGFGDYLTTRHCLSALDFERAIVGVGGDETIWMADQNQIAIALQLIAGISNDTTIDGMNRSAIGHGDIDAVILARCKAPDNAATSR